MEQQRIETYLNEYDLVTNKITSLSMKFANGSYVISISLVVGVTSINMSTDSLFKNGIFIALPIVVLFYLYNHIRYMVLQFKLSGYARALEEKINKISGDKALLWENSIARDNKQSSFEGVFCVIIYAGILFLVFYCAYYNLAIVCYGNWNISPTLFLIVTDIYYSFIVFICSFIILFINEHDRVYKKATSIYNKSIKNDKITLSNVIAEGQNDLSLKSKKNTDKAGKSPNKKPSQKSSRKPRKKSGRKRKKMCFLKILLILLFFLLIPISLFPLIFFSKHNVNDIEKTYDYIVVLGNKSPENGLSDDMKCRLDCLLKCIDDSNNSMIVVSGGNGEADKMKKYLLEQGIFDESIILEEYSKNTRENLENTRSLVTGDVLVITNDYHVFRTKLLCNKLDLDWDMLPAKSENKIGFKALAECYIVYWELLGLLGIGIVIFVIVLLICDCLKTH